MTINGDALNWLLESVLRKEPLTVKAALTLESFHQDQISLCFTWIMDMTKPKPKTQSHRLMGTTTALMYLDYTREVSVVSPARALLEKRRKTECSQIWLFSPADGRTQNVSSCPPWGWCWPDRSAPALPGTSALSPKPVGLHASAKWETLTASCSLDSKSGEPCMR